MNYAEIGLGPFPLPIPSFGIGHREQFNHHGWDASFQLSTIIIVTQLKASAFYHYYPKPNPASQFYFGPGIGLSAFLPNRESFTSSAFTLSPEFVFGKAYISDAGGKRFFQMQLSWPTYNPAEHDVHFMPLVVFSYGIAF